MNETLFVRLVAEGKIAVFEDGTVVSSRGVHVARRTNSYVTISHRFSGKRRTCQAHRLLWHVLRGPIPQGLQVNHKSGRKHDNRLDNLEIVTPRQNVLHARDTLGCFHGAANGNAKLTEEQVLELRRRASAGERLSVLAAERGLTRECVRLITKGKRWSKFLAQAEQQQVAA